ncbi:sodium- and chloride-dependent transporter XTRP3-like [Paramormyrops kingsleyae]|uniref:sodium- and chloride-dependent transporter XTRP3-like n=1 Tax=Paramormyrops kingsleyae TaxID=1676925 RepID=UPI003B97BFA7
MEADGRPSWDNPAQFILACVSYAVGLGNMWRFPYLCQMHGGGGFLIPYLIMLVLEGIPLFYMELAVGQKMRLGSIGAWSAISPYLGGLGIASVVTSLYLCIYYNVVIAWAFWYLFHSFQAELPWAACPANNNLTEQQECEVSSPTQYFWYRETLNITSSMEEGGGLHRGQTVCLLMAWVVVYLCIVKGVKSTGKVMYFTTAFPYVVLLIYFIRGVSLHGAANGIKYMFMPKMKELASPTTWINAATQIFFSLGLGFGSLVAFASYNQPHNDVQRQAVAVSLINSGTSIFASVVTFSIYGFKATFNYESCLDRARINLLNSFDIEEDAITNDNISSWVTQLNSTYPDRFASLSQQLESCNLESELDTAAEGAGLAFIVYSEAIKNMPVSQLWSVLYFSMLLMLGVGSMLGNVMAITTPLHDSKFLSRRLSSEALNGLVCIFCLLAGLGFTARSGNYWFTIFNDYACTFSLLFIVFVEMVGICCIYGLKRFEKDIEDMIGHRPNWYWKIVWAGVGPIILIGLFLFYMITYITGETSTYQAWDKDLGKSLPKERPPYAQVCIALLPLSSILCIPFCAFYEYVQRKKKREPEERVVSCPLTPREAC